MEVAKSANLVVMYSERRNFIFSCSALMSLNAGENFVTS